MNHWRRPFRWLCIFIMIPIFLEIQEQVSQDVNNPEYFTCISCWFHTDYNLLNGSYFVLLSSLWNLISFFTWSIFTNLSRCTLNFFFKISQFQDYFWNGKICFLMGVGKVPICVFFFWWNKHKGVSHRLQACEEQSPYVELGKILYTSVWSPYRLR